MKKFFWFIVFLFLVLPVNAVTLSGGVVYTVESARKEAFANVEYTIDKSIIESNLVDPNFRENKRAIKKGFKETSDRFIEYFSDGEYNIVYKNNLYFEFYYDKNGHLDQIGKRVSLNVPTKSYKYSQTGKLEEVVLYLSKIESYIFSPDGILIVHWLNNIGYDTNGNIISERF